jgi:hypothetical protein
MNTLSLKPVDETPDSTASPLLFEGNHLCYILEDGHREVKVRGETRIPARVSEANKVIIGAANITANSITHASISTTLA